MIILSALRMALLWQVVMMGSRVCEALVNISLEIALHQCMLFQMVNFFSCYHLGFYFDPYDYKVVHAVSFSYKIERCSLKNDSWKTFDFYPPLHS